MKALKVGIEERRADQLAEVERQINARYAEQKAAFKEVDARAAALVAEFNQRIIGPLYAPLVGEHPEWGGFAGLETSSPPDLERQLLRKRTNLEIEAATKAAQSRLVRWEADALEAIARTGIVSSEAQALLDQMASIDMLMPTLALPPTAENVVTEMVTAEGKMPWVSHKDRDDYWELDDHASRWREATRFPHSQPQKTNTRPAWEHVRLVFVALPVNSGRDHDHRRRPKPSQPWRGQRALFARRFRCVTSSYRLETVASGFHFSNSAQRVSSTPWGELNEMLPEVATTRNGESPYQSPVILLMEISWPG